MPIEYRINKEVGLIEAKWTGIVTIEEVREYWRSLASEPGLLEDANRALTDLREATLAFKGQELNALIQSLVIPTLQGRKRKTAIIVGRPAQYGTVRQYQVFAES
jgi:hypothetical protein